MEHIVQFAISIDDEYIKQSIEKNVEKEVIRKITEDVENAMFNKGRYFSPKEKTEPLRELIGDRIDIVLAENKDLILETASTKLAEKLFRTKAAKAILEGGSNEQIHINHRG